MRERERERDRGIQSCTSKGRIDGERGGTCIMGGGMERDCK